jgi:hypothetical protein
MVTRQRVHLPADGQTGRAVAAVAERRPASREASQRRLTADIMEETTKGTTSTTAHPWQWCGPSKQHHVKSCPPINILAWVVRPAPVVH